MSDTPLTDAAKHAYIEQALPITNIFEPMAKMERMNVALAAALAECAGYIASVRTDRRVRDTDGQVYCGQTRDWCSGAKDIAERANKLLEEHDNFNAS